jgi:hypothetical protein
LAWTPWKYWTMAGSTMAKDSLGRHFIKHPTW